MDQITLRAIPPGEHRFFVKAQDISGATSRTISFPDPADSQLPLHWVVKPVAGEILLVNDFAQDQSLYQVQSFYNQILDQLLGASGYSVWEIGSERTPLINSQNSLPYSSLDIEANLAYFKSNLVCSSRPASSDRRRPEHYPFLRSRRENFYQ